MAVNIDQLVFGSAGQFSYVVKNDPVDQVNADRPFLKWLLSHKLITPFMHGFVIEKLYADNGNAAQWFSGNDELNFIEGEPDALAEFTHYQLFRGFTLNGTDLSENGVVVTDDMNAKMTGEEKSRIIHLIKENYRKQKNDLQETLDRALHLDGTAGAKHPVGLDLFVSLTPAVGTIGGVSAADYTFWRNIVSTGIDGTAADTLLEAMDTAWRQASVYGGNPPDYILVGGDFLTAYKKALRSTNQGNYNVAGKGGAKVDGAIAEAYFNGVPLVYNPTFDALDDLYAPATPWSKRCYFLNSKSLKFRPNKGRWMANTRPQKLPNRDVIYFPLSTDFGLTLAQRNNMAVLAIS